MSISTPSACSPEIKRRPTVQAAFTIPTATTIPIRTGRRLRASALIASTTDPVSHGKASAPACAPTASRTEAATEILYGARNPRRRTKVLRLLGAVVFTFSGYAPFPIRLSSARTRSTACSTRLRFAGELSQPLEPLLHPGRLAEEIGALLVERGDHRRRLERVAGLDAGSADAEVALERPQRPVGRAAPRHAARTATNHLPARRVSPPPSSAASPSALNHRLYTCQREPSLSTRSWRASSCSDDARDESTTTSSGATRRASARKRSRSGPSRCP